MGSFLTTLPPLTPLVIVSENEYKYVLLDRSLSVDDRRNELHITQCIYYNKEIDERCWNWEYPLLVRGSGGIDECSVLVSRHSSSIRNKDMTINALKTLVEILNRNVVRTMSHGNYAEIYGLQHGYRVIVIPDNLQIQLNSHNTRLKFEVRAAIGEVYDLLPNICDAIILHEEQANRDDILFRSQTMLFILYMNVNNDNSRWFLSNTDSGECIHLYADRINYKMYSDRQRFLWQFGSYMRTRFLKIPLSYCDIDIISSYGCYS